MVVRTHRHARVDAYIHPFWKIIFVFDVIKMENKKKKRRS
jgi:hypothetical protein